MKRILHVIVFLCVMVVLNYAQSNVWYSNDMESEVSFGGEQSGDLSRSGQYSEKLSAGSDVYSLARFDDSSKLPVLESGESFSSFVYDVWVNDNDNASQTYKLLVRFGNSNDSWSESDFYSTDEMSIGGGWDKLSYDITDIVNARVSEGYTNITRIAIRSYNSGTFTDYYVDDILFSYEKSGQSGEAPQITSQPQSQTKQAGETALFSVAASGSEPLSYQWYLNGSAISGAASSSYTTPTLAESDNGNGYYCVVSNDYGSATSSTATLTVGVAQQIWYSNDMESEVSFGGEQSGDLSRSGQYSEKLSAGSDVYSLARFDDSSKLPVLETGESFSSFVYEVWVNDNDNASQTYKLLVRFGNSNDSWSESDFYSTDEMSIGGGWGKLSYDITDIVNARVSEGYTNITRIAIRSYNSGTYTDYYVDDILFSYEKSSQSGEAPQITSQPQSQTKQAGETALFSVTASGSEPLSYQWYLNGNAISGAASSSYTTPSLTESDNGNEYYCVVSNDYGSAASSTATLTVGVAQQIWYSNDMESEVSFGGEQSGDLSRSGQYSEKLSAGSDVYSLARFDDSSKLPVLESRESFSSFIYDVWINDNDNASQAYKLLVRFGNSNDSWSESDYYSTDQMSIGSGWGKLSYDIADIVNARVSEGYTHITRICIRAYNSDAYVDYYVDDISFTYEKSGPVGKPIIDSQPLSVIKNVGETASFGVSAKGSEPFSYHWYLNGGAIDSATGSTYTTPTLSAEDDGSQFYCIVSNSYGSDTSDVAKLTINDDSGSDDIIIADDGNAYYVIYYDAQESDVISFAASELGSYLQKISGAEFTVTTNENQSGKMIVIGRNNPLTQNITGDMDFSAITDDGFRILSKDDNIYIAGSIDRGSLYGVYHFLDQYLGVRWFADDFEVVPALGTISVEAMNDLQNPRFTYREIFAGSDDPYYRQHNRLNGSRFHRSPEYNDYPSSIDTWSKHMPGGTPEDGNGGHNFQTIVSSTYHSGGQLLTMEDGCRAEAATHFENVIPDYGEDTWYGFTQMDNTWSPDDDSRSFADAHGNALSAPIVDMVTDVANRVRQSIPNAKFATFAYQFSFNPPSGLTIPDYVLVEAAPIEADFGRVYTDPKNSVVSNALNGWNQIVSNLNVWDYITNFQNYLQPWPNIYPMCDNIKYMATLENMKGYFGQGAYGSKGAELVELRTWVAARLLWNPDLDYMTLIDEFCDGYYGSASTYVKQYIRDLHQAFENSGDRLSVKQRITSDYLNVNFIINADNLMAQADAAAGGEYSKHVHALRATVDMTILLREHLYEHDAEEQGITWTHDPNRRARFEQYVNEVGITDYNEGSPIEDIYAAMDINRVYPPVPDVAEGLADEDWIDYQDLDFKICCSALIMEDSLSSDNGTVRLTAGDGWAIQLPLDILPADGKWTFYAYARADLKDGYNPDGSAIAMGVYPGGDFKYVKASEFADGKYHTLEFLNMPVSFETGKYLWFSPEDEIDYMYVDRIVAVRTDAAEKRVAGIADENGLLPKKFELQGNYPNPFNPTTKINYALPKASRVKLTIYNVRGQKLAVLVNRWEEAGYKSIRFNAAKYSSGIYFYRLEAGDFVMTKRMLLIK